MTHSGIAPIDGAIGGLAAGRVHILTGAPGVGKSAACLQFLYTGLQRGEPVLLVATQPTRDLRALAAHLGLDLRVSLLEERLLLLRWDLGRGTVGSLGDAMAGARAVEELRDAIARQQPTRIAVDSVLPFVEDGSAAGAPVAALAAALAGVTTVVTYPGDLAHAYDRRLDPLLQEAAAILHLARDGQGAVSVDVVKGPAAADAAMPASHRFTIARGRGIEPVPSRPALAHATARPRTGRLLLLHTADAPEPETMTLLGRDHGVTARFARADRLDGEVADAVDAVIVETSHQALDDVLALVHELSRRGGAAPILTFARFNVRSADRARALAAGADDTLAGDMSTAELQLRLAMAIERGRSRTHPALPRDEAPVRHPVDAEGRALPMDGAAFARALATHAAGGRVDHGTVLDVAVASGPAGSAGDAIPLAQVALRAVRLGGGDLVAVTDGGVAVYLHDARRRDTNAFVERLRADWARLDRGALRVAVRAHPHLTADARVPRAGAAST